MLLIHSERFADHVMPPGHPERVERAEVYGTLARRWRAGGGAVESPRPASIEAILRVHSAEHVALLEDAAGRAVMLDSDTFTSPDSFDVARLAAGAAVGGVDYALERGRPSVALVRPPGHHAERSRAMGFCLLNNVAIAAAEALARGIDRVAVVDFDVHHGNGTEAIFYEEPRVLYVSTHQFPFYPGTGAASDTGRGRGAGFTLNIPLEAGATDADFRAVFDEAVEPVLRAYEPGLVLVSAGYDADARDPLGGMRVTPAGFAAMSRSLWRVAADCAGGRLVAVTEGGYDLTAVAEGVTATLDALAADPEAPLARVEAPPPVSDRQRADRALAAVRQASKPFWPAL